MDRPYTCICISARRALSRQDARSARRKQHHPPAPAVAAVFPAGVAHCWWNAGDDLLEASGRAIPAVDLDRYLQALFAVLNAGPSGRPSIFYLAHVLWRHRHTQAAAAPPRIIQRIVFPVVVLVGHVLGKYRGDAWSGSPASCTSAPEVPGPETI